MKLRKMTLARTWYPGTAAEVEEAVSAWADKDEAESCSAAVVPHAGWYYSGKIAAQTLSAVSNETGLVVVIGGHLPTGADILGAFEQGFELPGGIVSNRLDILDELKKTVNIEEDLFRDNTVEVVLPMAAFFAPGADFLWLRAPSDMSSVVLADALFEITEKKKIKTAVIGSTDLTHYGSSYYFEPEGRGAAALGWVKDVNDAGIITRMLNMNPEAVLAHAAAHKSACSAGAAAAAVRFGLLKGASEGSLVDYYTSYDISPADSFVGYAGVRF